MCPRRTTSFLTAFLPPPSPRAHRKTGVQPPPVERDANGFEAVGNFFPPSSSPAKKKTTTAVGGAGGSSVRIHGSAARGLDAYGGGGSDAEGGETVDASDMEIDQGAFSSLSR